MKKGLSEAAKVLPETGTTFEEYIRKAIELSGKQEELDKIARAYGYKDALDQTVESHRIIRAMMSIMVEEKLQNMPDQVRSMAQDAIKDYMPQANESDIKYVSPYMRTLKTLHLK